jgi:hypothetical protein
MARSIIWGIYLYSNVRVCQPYEISKVYPTGYSTAFSFVAIFSSHAQRDFSVRVKQTHAACFLPQVLLNIQSSDQKHFTIFPTEHFSNAYLHSPHTRLIIRLTTI